MSGQLKVWLEKEMKEYSELFKDFRKKVKKMVPVWMAISIIAMVALGVGVGYDLAYVARVHLLIGVGIAVIIWFGFWVQGKAASMKQVLAVYEKEIGSFFCGPEDEEAFCKQMAEGRYTELHFMNTKAEAYPARFLVGPDYWVLFAGNCNCSFVRTADIAGISGREEQTRISSGGVRARVTVGVSLIVKYKDGSPSAARERDKEMSMFLSSGDQFRKLMDAIARNCPQAQRW